MKIKNFAVKFVFLIDSVVKMCSLCLWHWKIKWLNPEFLGLTGIGHPFYDLVFFIFFLHFRFSFYFVDPPKSPQIAQVSNKSRPFATILLMYPNSADEETRLQKSSYSTWRGDTFRITGPFLWESTWWMDSHPVDSVVSLTKGQSCDLRWKPEKICSTNNPLTVNLRRHCDRNIPNAYEKKDVVFVFMPFP